MNSNMNTPNFIQDEDNIDFAQELKRYLRFWPWFLLSLILFGLGAYTYLRYSARIYQTSAKIKILDESEGLELPTSAFVFKRTNINLENEIEILTSYLLLEKVVKELDLTLSIYEEGRIRTLQLAELPFFFEKKFSSDSIFNGVSYKIEVSQKGLEVNNLRTNQIVNFSGHDTKTIQHNLPFELKVEKDSNFDNIIDRNYILRFSPIKQSALRLKGALKVEPVGEQSDLLKLSIKGESFERSEYILNTLIDVFNKDGVNDRQLISKRTLDFIDDRFLYLANELDSIELNKKDFKQDNNLVYMQSDAELSLQKRAESDEEVFRIENQMALSNLLEEALGGSSSNSGLLPSNIGIDNSGINSLLNNYNSIALERDKIIVSGGINNPTVKILEDKIKGLRQNIDRSLDSYKKQLSTSLGQLKTRNRRFRGEVSSLPKKEKLLRAIERQQKIKESLYLLLLQKREEAAINYAITEPSVKVVEYALSGSNPISPKNSIIYAAAMLAGMLIPFGLLYVSFVLDNKIHGKEDIEKITSNSPVIGEIPMIKDKKMIFDNPSDKSILSESFRILSSNVNYILPSSKSQSGKIIYCTSTIKGEGKTYVSVNLSLALSSINKKVLLIGADLRNPQIHSSINSKKDLKGLTNYLYEDDIDWHDSIIKGFDMHPNHHTIISGPIPPNPAHLLTNGKFEKLLEEAKLEFDYIIVDTAPTILVTDTMLISQNADATLYITRANYTEKNLLKFAEDLKDTGKLKNLAYVINGVGASRSKKYGYNYGYGYGYGSKNQ